ncbi:N-acyl homoserine lactonase family protein [Plantactinospora sp. S1510]|uniref:N-acyl homoserine lactonase family protein n=2 Tax=Plantactinospora alkalitolerans TaxID=2789879 RepID=A0ABS0H981_9ACTN|nr:N-acyl homoserine lactonase family protein [Plantactinospora alkalitolerans]
MTVRDAEVRRLDLGYFVRPAVEVGGPEPRVEPAYGYLVRRPEGLLLFDTGIGAVDPDTEAHYRPRRRPLATALDAAGVGPDDITLVVNCHLHFDHCGGNPALAGRPIVVQRTELTVARTPGHTIPELVDFPGARYEELDGEAEIWPGVRIVPTPGHTAGHQSLVLRQLDGTVILAGQARDFATGYGSDELALRASRDGVAAPLPPVPAWLPRLVDLDPARILFAHDGAVWEPASG